MEKHAPIQAQQFIADALSNPYNRAILDAWEQLDLQGGWLVAGCLFQTVWNLKSGRSPSEGIKDYDIFYFDPQDLSAHGQARVQQRVDQVIGSLGVPIEVTNQARVHLWYEDHFGFPYPALRSACDGIDRFLIPCTSVALRMSGHRVDLYAPDGLDDLYAGRLRPNPLTPHLPLFRAKAQSYRQRWAWLTVTE